MTPRTPTKTRVTIRRAVRNGSTYDVEEVVGYVPWADSRFAVVPGFRKGSWTTLHIASGMSVDSLIPDELWGATLTKLLSIVADWQSQGLDLSVMDDVTFGKGFNTRGDQRIMPLMDEFRRIAASHTGLTRLTT